MKSGRTALHLAAMKGHVDVVELLVRKGAGLEKKSKDGKAGLDWVESERERLESCAKRRRVSGEAKEVDQQVDHQSTVQAVDSTRLDTTTTSVVASTLELDT